MREVTFLSHLWLACAVPSHQVLSAAAGEISGGTQEARLWPPHSERADHRLLEVQTQAGPRRLRCASVKLGSLVRDRVWPLPPLLRDILSLPHVVGIAELDDGPVWLVDLKRFCPTIEY
jgi:hypothetical protein